MEALYLHAPHQAPAVRDIPAPLPGPGQVRIRVVAAGICGSDTHIVHGANPAARFPLILGHEIAGVVEKAGSEEDQGLIGMPVAVNFLITCGTCRQCAAQRSSLCQRREGLGIVHHGGLAEYVVVPTRNIIPIPDGVPFDHAAIATDAYATPWHAIRKSGISAGEGCLLNGAGGLGLAAVQLLSALGVGPIAVVDPRPEARKAAVDAGADNVSAKVSELQDPPLLPHIFDFVGISETISSLLELLPAGGQLSVVGLGGPMTVQMDNSLVRDEKTVTGSYAFTDEDISYVLQKMAEGKLNPDQAIGRTISLGEAPAALDPAGPERGYGRTVVRM
ncbi:zinc-dependent alcohol dehydrogenase [Nesterenkonia alkaliphila]|uniref:Alcohol dehydrogenase catalytic domain-containing protein n=1 Tax=Nesterenkonia alkaliphila TaxID=1463631 RepID=A0A7K1UES0_9MICC|nr:alcohol dehydrogenase catalytic domain-containing protein [Nesterenkonia alkaliphila]MVT24973.1 alcohol dehydrogenase catalytic domain-containing protein [Nesterenkonia alkaliphila]GFZ87016.1 alcohol dehydrogenase [Nesterenkonia alkaliphila]